jgi:hypothetical protein
VIVINNSHVTSLVSLNCSSEIYVFSDCLFSIDSD